MLPSEHTSLSWRRSARSQYGEGSIYRRPLGAGELQFYWDTVFYGTSVTIGHLVLEAEPEYEKETFCKENVELAWMRMKQRFPLLGASVDESPGSELVEFVLDEASLCTIRHGEISFLNYFQSVEDVTRLIDTLQNGPPVLTNEIIAKLMVGPQKDTPRIYHAIIVIAHFITDGITGMTLKRELCQELAKLSRGDIILSKPLEKRLESLTPVEILGPDSRQSPSWGRWRSAVAKVIYELRQARLKGGHTLPTTRPIRFGTPALSCTLTLRLSGLHTKRVLDKCRELGITFGNALPVLSQLAFARVLYKRPRERSPMGQRLPGASDAEWEYRRTQPMHFAGPLNLRPYLDRTWYDTGGASDVCTTVGSYNLTLPYMPTSRRIYDDLSFDSAITEPHSLALWLKGPRVVNCYVSDEPQADDLIDDLTEDNAPSFSSLLSPQRFLHRARMVRAQNAAFVHHPLLHELQVVHMREMCRRSRDIGLAWRAKQHGRKRAGSTSTDLSADDGYVISNGGASLGNRDLLLPLDYPLPSKSYDGDSTRIAPRLHIRDNIIHLRCRPGELYLGALTTQGQLTFFVYVDARVYDMSVVEDWLENVRAATLHYLCDNVSGVRPEGMYTKSTSSLANVPATMGEDGFLRAKL